MASWAADWHARQQAIVTEGLPVHVVGIHMLPPWEGRRLLAMELAVDEHRLPRTHAQRGFELHMSLIFHTEMREELWEAARRANDRWAGRDVILDIAWFRSGGTAFLAGGNAVSQDPDIQLLHSAGYFADRGLHVSL